MAFNKSMNHRKLGDQHRNARQWPEAAAAYATHLKLKPEDIDIWVQYGHALKESGKIQEAEAAYRKAEAARPEDADIHIQLGHVLKIQENYVSAIAEYSRAFEMDSNAAIEDEIRRLRTKIKHEPKAVLGENATLYSIQDMFGYLNAHRTMSGIQRVQAGIALNLIDSNAADTEFVLTDGSGGLTAGDFWLLDKASVRAVIDYASLEYVDHHKLRELLRACERTAVACRAGAGHTIIILGAFWGLGNTPSCYLPAKRAGARIGAYVYDIIPISHPEYCEVELSRFFALAFGELCMIADFILTISEFTRTTLVNLLESNGGRQIPMTAVPLAHSLTASLGQGQAWPNSLKRLRGGEYVAYVSTIEGRKNHTYVVKVWQQLIERGIEVPDLVFVGRHGWRISGLMDLLESTNYLNGRVHIVHDLSDVELNAVYKNALFTVFTSFVEGWGLPVGESLLHGTPCVAAGTSSIPEVGGDFVDYVDPYNITNGVEVIGRMITDRGYLAQRRQNIADNFTPRGWDDVASDFQAQVETYKAWPVTPPGYPMLTEGAVFRPGDLANQSTDLRERVRNPKGFLIVETFYHPEDFGAWMKGAFGEVTFATGLPAGTQIVVYLETKVTPWHGDTGIIVRVSGQDRAQAKRFTLARLATLGPLAIRGVVDDEGACRVTLEIDGKYSTPDTDTRDFVIGLSALGFASVANPQARADVFENLFFTQA